MLDYLIVGLIVLAAAIYTLRKYAPRLFGKSSGGGCDSGCSNCASGRETPAQPEAGRQRVIKLHSR